MNMRVINSKYFSILTASSYLGKLCRNRVCLTLVKLSFIYKKCFLTEPLSHKNDKRSFPCSYFYLYSIYFCCKVFYFLINIS